MSCSAALSRRKKPEEDDRERAILKFSNHFEFIGRECTGGVIESAHLSKLYDRGVYALRDLSLTVEKGEFVFLTGPSGAGKSTFLRLLLREELPSEGELRVLGRDLKTLRPSQVQTFRRSVGFVFQDFRLIPRFTVFENVAFVMRVLGIPDHAAAQDLSGVEVGRPAASDARVPRGTLRRRAAAHRDRARARQRSAARDRRRA